MGRLSGVLCQGRGPPLWQGCCEREEQALPYAGPAPPLPCLPNPSAPAAIGVGSRGEEDPQHSQLETPLKGIKHPKPQQTQAHRTIPNSLPRQRLRIAQVIPVLYQPENIFWHPTSLACRCRCGSGSFSGSQGHQKPPTALKPTSWIRLWVVFFSSSSLNNGGAASSAGLQVAMGSPERDGGPGDVPFLPGSPRWGGHRRSGAARSPLEMEPWASPGSVSSTPCPRPQNLGQGRRRTPGTLLLPAEPLGSQA